MLVEVGTILTHASVAVTSSHRRRWEGVAVERGDRAVGDAVQVVFTGGSVPREGDHVPAQTSRVGREGAEVVPHQASMTGLACRLFEVEAVVGCHLFPSEAAEAKGSAGECAMGMESAQACPDMEEVSAAVVGVVGIGRCTLDQ